MCATDDETSSPRTVSGYALYSEMYADPARPVNVARFVFLNRRARTFFLDWATAANDMVAALRAEAGSKPYDRELSDLVGELTTRSEQFALSGLPERPLSSQRHQRHPPPSRRRAAPEL